MGNKSNKDSVRLGIDLEIMDMLFKIRQSIFVVLSTTILGLEVLYVIIGALIWIFTGIKCFSYIAPIICSLSLVMYIVGKHIYKTKQTVELKCRNRIDKLLNLLEENTDDAFYINAKFEDIMEGKGKDYGSTKTIK